MGYSQGGIVRHLCFRQVITIYCGINDNFGHGGEWCIYRRYSVDECSLWFIQLWTTVSTSHICVTDIIICNIQTPKQSNHTGYLQTHIYYVIFFHRKSASNVNWHKATVGNIFLFIMFPTPNHVCNGMSSYIFCSMNAKFGIVFNPWTAEPDTDRITLTTIWLQMPHSYSAKSHQQPLHYLI